MSPRLIQPGASAVLRHPKTGELLSPLYVRKDGSAVWPVLGASSDDPNDPAFTGGGEDDSDDDSDDEDGDESDDDDSDDDDKDDDKDKKKSKSKKDEDDDEPSRPERQAARYRTQLRAEQKRNAEMASRLKALEDKDKKPDEIAAREAQEAADKASKAEARNRQLTLENAFFRANTVDWVDPADALKLVDLSEIDVDDDGIVDAKDLRAALKDLARRKPHLVKKPKAASTDDDEDDKGQGPGRRMNGKRRGSGKDEPTREELAKKFPVLGRFS